MKKVLVTGGSRGIGAATVKAFRKVGYDVYANYVSDDSAAKQLAADCGCHIYKADVSDLDAVKRMHGDIGRVDVLVNNAGIALNTMFQYATPEQVERLYGVNLFGTLNCIRVFAPDMLNEKDGVIINMSSIWGEVGGSCEADYSASKAAIIGLTKALAKEFGTSWVRVNCISPGIIDTDMNAELTVETVEEIVDSVPLERLGKAEDVAETALFLASDAASYITGQVIAVDGGWRG